MSYVIAYKSKIGNYSYLTESNGFKYDITDSDIIEFTKFKTAKNHIGNNIAAKTLTKILKRHNVKNFELLNLDEPTSAQPIFSSDEAEALMYKYNIRRPKEIKIKTIDELSRKLNQIKNTTAIIDLEFYLDKCIVNKRCQHIKQIAAVPLNDSQDNFNMFVFNSENMKEENQFDFFKKMPEVPYVQASNYTSKYIVDKLVDFCRTRGINNLISWDNHNDFHMLYEEGCLSKLGGFTSIDLETILARINKQKETQEGRVKLNLKSFCNLLNLSNDGKWHDALSDCQMIRKVCLFYSDIVGKADELIKEA